MASKRTGKRIESAPAPITVRVRFSFEFYDLTQDKYCLSKAEPLQVRRIMERLRQINEKTFAELNQAGAVLHFHSVDWDKTRERHGFPYAQLADFEAFQVALLGVNGQKARLYGAYSANIFYVVWFDLEHHIWPSFKRHT